MGFGGGMAAGMGAGMGAGIAIGIASGKKQAVQKLREHFIAQGITVHDHIGKELVLDNGAARRDW